MSIISNTAAQRDNIGIRVTGTRLIKAPLTALKRWWTAYTSWRVRQAVVACLKPMSDRQLKDIGLSRSEIDFAVAGRRHRNPEQRWYDWGSADQKRINS